MQPEGKGAMHLNLQSIEQSRVVSMVLPLLAVVTLPGARGRYTRLCTESLPHDPASYTRCHAAEIRQNLRCQIRFQTSIGALNASR